jgi:hypothetical protein
MVGFLSVGVGVGVFSVFLPERFGNCCLVRGLLFVESAW